MNTIATSIFVALSALAVPAPATRILVLDLARSDVRQEDERVLATAIAEALAKGHGARVVMTSADLRTLSSVAANQQECGADATSCLADLAGAMDVQQVVHGSVSRIDDDILVQLRVFDAKNAAAGGARVSWRGRTLGAVLAALPPHVAELMGDAPSSSSSGSSGSSGSSAGSSPAGVSPLWGGAALAAGVLVGGGTALAGGAYNHALTDPSSSRTDKDTALGLGRIVVAAGSIGAVGLGVTGAALLATADWE